MHGSHSSLQQHTHYPHHQRPASLADQSVSTPPNRPVSAIVTSREQEQIFNNIGQPYLMNNSIDPTSSNQTMDPALRRDPRELLRQEAKMEEIREELRRRDDRLQQNNNAYHNAIARNTGNNLSRPRLPTNSQSSIAGFNNNGAPSINGFRSNGPVMALRSNCPPPPAPKPMRGSMSHVYNGNNAQPSNYRYNSTSAIGANNYPASKSGVMSPSPWEREEKEKVHLILINII